MSRDEISARLHRESPRALPKLYRSGFRASAWRARLSAAILPRTRRRGLRGVALSSRKMIRTGARINRQCGSDLAFPEKFGGPFDFRWQAFVHRTIQRGLLEHFAMRRIRR